MNAPSLRCEYLNCTRAAVGHHAPSCTNLCDHHFKLNELRFGILFAREPVKRTYKSKDFETPTPYIPPLPNTGPGGDLNGLTGGMVI